MYHCLVLISSNKKKIIWRQYILLREKDFKGYINRMSSFTIEKNIKKEVQLSVLLKITYNFELSSTINILMLFQLNISFSADNRMAVG